MQRSSSLQHRTPDARKPSDAGAASCRGSAPLRANVLRRSAVLLGERLLPAGGCSAAVGQAQRHAAKQIAFNQWHPHKLGLQGLLESAQGR